MAEVKARSLAVLALAVLLPGAWISQGLADHEAVFPMPKEKQYVDECGSCHTAYAPGLLPARSWLRLMAGLERHFGEDASIEATVRDRLTRSLVELAADSPASNLLMQRINAAIPAGDTPERITRGGFFKYMHDEVPAAIWNRPGIGSPANCGACHTKANSGRYPEREILIPK